MTAAIGTITQSEAVKAAIAKVDVALLQSERIEQMGDYVHRCVTALFPVAQTDKKAAWKLCRRLLAHNGTMCEFQLLDEHRATFIEESRL